jgi:plasmid stabilization system protein ParE
MVIIWGDLAKSELTKIYNYIALDSVQNAEMVRDNLINAVGNLAKNPFKHPLDFLKIDNDGTWRAFEKYHYRISYQIYDEQVLIARIRHTSRSPLTY